MNILKDTNKIAIGKVVLKDKEHLVALRPYQRAIVMHQLKYLDEIKPMDEVDSISNIKQPAIQQKEISLGKTLVESLSSEQFDIGKYHDRYIKELEKLIIAKSKGKEVKVEKEEKITDTTDLVEALKASIGISNSKNKKIDNML